MTVTYDPHLRERLKERHIPESWPREIIEQSAERYRDATTGYYVSIAKRWYNGKEREMAVTYVEQGMLIYKAITIHPIGNKQKQNRIDVRRWVRI